MAVAVRIGSEDAVHRGALRLVRQALEMAGIGPEDLATIRAKAGFDPVFGARPLKRAIQQRIENPLSKLILEGRFPPKTAIPVDVDPVREPGVFHFGNAQPVPEEATA